jgi:hypothetical protein
LLRWKMLRIVGEERWVGTSFCCYVLIVVYI